MHDTDALDRAIVGGLRRWAQRADESSPADTGDRLATGGHSLRFALAHTARGR